ncbi:MAG: hypothetical protein ACHRXM_29370 [Isosphaerales bacterium]
MFGLGHADSVRNLTRRVDAISRQPSAISAYSVRDLTRRVDRAVPGSNKIRQGIAAIRQELLKTERICLPLVPMQP